MYHSSLFCALKKKTNFKEKLLHYIDLSRCTTRLKIFNLLNKYFSKKKNRQKKLFWRRSRWYILLNQRTDEAVSMTGYRSGVVVKIKVVYKEMLFTHCIIHREHLTSKKLFSDLKNVLTNTVKIRYQFFFHPMAKFFSAFLLLSVFTPA